MAYSPVTILLCTYNGEKYIEEQLDSLLNQTYPDILIRVYDDGSTDHTLQIIQSIKQERKIDNARLTVCVNEKPSGSARANFMQAIEKNKDAEYIALCDQDDIWLPEKIDRMMECAVQHDQQGSVPFLVCHGAERIDAGGNTIDTIHIPELDFYWLVQHPTVQGSCMLFNRKCTDLIRFDADRIAMHDWYISLVYSMNHKIHIIDQPLMKYRIHDNNVNGHRGTNLMTRVKWLLDDREKVAFRKESLEQLYQISIRYDHPFLKEYREAYDRKNGEEVVQILEKYHCLDEGARKIIQKRENKKALRKIQAEETTVYLINNNPKGQIVEGGSSRLIAWEIWLRTHVKHFSDIRLKTGKLAHNLQVFSTLLFKRNSVILFLYPVIGVPIFYLNSFEKIASAFFFRCLQASMQRNTVVFDISDLKYEQAIDLELMNTPFGIRGEEIEKELFSSDAYFIFASYHMRDYACSKYGILAEKTDVCINGGERVHPEAVLPVQADRKAINYVYAGTLNKGRQIEQLLDVFPEDEQYHLYLLGPSGEWIGDTRRNITYLGPLQEEIAHHFVSTCDVGLIPYDETRLYYNLAYPTKLSFYITAQIPFISTPVDEVKDVNQKIDGGWLAPVSEWGKLIHSISREAIREKKKHVSDHSSEYLWENILSASRFIH